MTDDDQFDWIPDSLAALGLSDEVQSVERVDLRSPGADLSALRWGDDDPRLVFLHGGGQNAHTWDLVISILGVPSLAIDLPGHGHSAWRADQDYSATRSAQTIVELLDSVKIAKLDGIVGMSLGGLTAIAAIGDRPQLARRAVVVDVLPGVDEVALTLTTQQLGPAAVAQYAPTTFASLDEMVEVILRASPGRDIETLRRGVIHNSTRTEDGRWRWRYDDLRNSIPAGEGERLWEALATSPSPFMLVRGGSSRFVPPGWVERLERTRPDARVEVVAGAGHSIQSSHPAKLASLIRDFVPISGR